MSDVTQILNAIESGNAQAAEQLFPLVYDKLRKLAAAEVGVSPEEFAKGLGRVPALARVFGPLRVEGGTVQHDALVKHFGDLAGVLLMDAKFRGTILNDPNKDIAIDLGGGQKLKLVLIPAGTFTMGSDNANGSNESPAHKVTISKSFYMGQFTVTVGQFKRFVAEEQYKTEAETNGKGGYATIDGHAAGPDPKYNWRNPGFPQTDEHPVVNVTWNDAQAFCKWLAKKSNGQRELAGFQSSIAI